MLEGECQYGDQVLRLARLGSHYETRILNMKCGQRRGVRSLFVQYPGLTPGEAPIYDGRFNQKEKPKLEEQDLER